MSVHPPLKIAFSTGIPSIKEADAVCQQAVLDTAHLLERLGHQVGPGCPTGIEKLEKPFTTVFQAVLNEAGVPEIFLEKMNRWFSMRARFCSCGKYLRAVDQMQIIAREIVSFFDAVDVLLLPTYLHPPIRVGE